jgi:hypothetical protein
MGYPYGPLYRLLVLSGLRLAEACGAHWSEFYLEKREWTIPAARMKKVKGGAKPFMVPLTDAMLAVLNALPRFTSGEFLFSHSHGKRPLKPNQFSDIKGRLDALLLEELKNMATECGRKAKAVTLPDFVNHDIRRTVRTHLSALKVPEEVREAVLAHVRPGIKGVYDKHDYFSEKKQALELWAARLRSIVEPPPSNVVELATARVPRRAKRPYSAERREFADAAMRALGSSNSRARRWTISLAARYRRMTSPLGVYKRAAKFSDWRQQLRAQAAAADKLAERMIALTPNMRVVFPYLLGERQSHDEAIWRRYELTRGLREHADEVRRLLKSSRWPKGGKLDLAKVYLGPAKQWLVQGAIKVFFHHGNINEIKPMSGRTGSRLGDYVGAVYHLATGSEPWAEGVGLDKIVNQVARAYRRREMR